MATYYVSATTGAGSPDGLTAATSYASVTALMSGRTLASGDVIFIAPGTYREQIDCTAEGVSGTAADPIRWIGDPNCENFSGIQPGVVRFTLSNEDDVANEDNTFATTDRVIDVRNVAYHYFYNLYLDGGTADSSDPNTHQTNAGIYGNQSTTEDENKVFNCHFQNFTRAALDIHTTQDCTFISNGYAGPYAVSYVDRCVVIGGGYPVFNCEEVANSVIMGGGNMNVYNTTTTINCTILGGRTGVYSATANTDHAWNNHIIGNWFVISGQNSTTKMFMSGSRIDGNYQIANKGIYNRVEYGGGMSALGDSNSPGGATVKVAKPMCLWTMEQVREMGKMAAPQLLNHSLRGLSTDSPLLKNGNAYTVISNMTTDFTGGPRKMGVAYSSSVGVCGDTAGLRDVGAFEFSENNVSASLNGMVTMSIEGEGQFVIPVGVASASSITISADVKWESTTMTQKPQLILRQAPGEYTSSLHLSQSGNYWHSGSVLELCSVTHPNASTNNWETITVSSSTVPSDTQLEFVLYSRNTGSASTSSMANIFIR